MNVQNALKRRKEKWDRQGYEMWKRIIDWTGKSHNGRQINSPSYLIFNTHICFQIVKYYDLLGTEQCRTKHYTPYFMVFYTKIRVKAKILLELVPHNTLNKTMNNNKMYAKTHNFVDNFKWGKIWYMANGKESLISNNKGIPYTKYQCLFVRLWKK